jgi:predicted nucleic acid-binding protein
MTVTVFVDTNVFVYVRDAREKAKQQIAADWIARLWDSRSGRTSIQVLSEFYVTVTRKLDPGLKPADAWADVLSLLAWQPQAIDAALVRRARDIESHYRMSWWDSLIIAAAQAQDCAILLSEDLQNGGDFGGVTVRNPFEFRVSDIEAAYRPMTRKRRMSGSRRA